MNIHNKLACILALTGPLTLSAEVLQPGTLKAWNEYVEAAHSRIADRLTSTSQLPWIGQKQDRSSKLRKGQILVAPVGAHDPIGVPGGLIHDWIGAVFIPEVKIDDVLAFVRDYSVYKDFYKPIVIDSKPLGQVADQDKYSVVFLDKTLLSNIALDCDFESSYRQLDNRRWYSIAHATRVQEIEDYGEPNQHKLPPDQGGGYLWRIYRTAAFEQRDGGVYMEVEAIALSRDVPELLKWVLDPLIRRVARRAFVAFLQDTRDGVRSTLEAKNNGADHSLSLRLAARNAAY